MKKSALFLLLSIAGMLKCMQQMPELNEITSLLSYPEDTDNTLFGINFLHNELQPTERKNQEQDQKQPQNEEDPNYIQFLKYVKEKLAPKPQQELSVQTDVMPLIQVHENNQIPSQTESDSSSCLLCQTYKNNQLKLHKYWHKSRENYRCEICQLASDSNKFHKRHKATPNHKRTLQLHTAHTVENIRKYAIETTNETKKRKRITSKEEDNDDEYRVSDEEYESDEIDNYKIDENDKDSNDSSGNNSTYSKKCTLGECIYIDTNHNFARHQKGVHGDYPCYICKIQTGSRGALLQHKMEHDNYNNLDLKKCPKPKCIFRNKYLENVKRHQKCDHGDYPCPICYLQTGSIGALMQHTRIVHSNKKK